ncbi:LuxR family transcriptional regulator [Streptomyces zaomyceticus]|uniref:helix-turn-helix transcriptional regulator n=1 Tax=Streptomyces zaomyceticus TaxID=68286 RepID=UPI003657E6E7
MPEDSDAAGLAALQTFVLHRLDEIREAQLAFAWDKAHGPGEAGAGTERIEILEGAEAIAARYTELQRAARKEIFTLAAGPVVAVPAGGNAGQREAMRAGVHYRVVYERSSLALERTETPLLLEHWSALGEEMRVAFELPMKLVLVDRRIALIVPREHRTGGPTASVLDSPVLIGALGWIFDRIWQSALPVPAALASAVDGPLTAADKQLLTLLLSGYTDQAIASQLSVSLRTVQRRVRRLLALAGAQSRLQLGWHAAHHHWA